MELITASDVLNKLLVKAERIAGTEEPILILGETGTGKDLLATWIHNHSKRATAPFLPLNCTALPESLIESELFGYRKGAFTDARTDKAGLFESVKGGTIFLDEIGELPEKVQVKLLRVIETHTVLPVGALEPIRVHFRLISATNKDLVNDRNRNGFRDDLFYRIGVFVLNIPPLRERLEEIPVLAEHFAHEVNPRLRLTPLVVERLMCYPWPGNIRELRNAMRHAALLTDDGTISMEHLPDIIQENCRAEHIMKSGRLKEKVHCFEQALLERYLEEHNGDLDCALRDLGIARSSFYRKLRSKPKVVHKKNEEASAPTS